MRRTLGILLTLVALVCPTGATPNGAAEEIDVREATYRYQFANNASGRQGRVDAYYLSIRVQDGRDSDPPEELMKRFAGNIPPVRKVSQCIASSDNGVVDRKTGGSGLIFNTAGIKWVSPTEVEVLGGYYAGNMSASGNTYYLKKIDGKWKVLKDVLHWIA